MTLTRILYQTNGVLLFSALIGLLCLRTVAIPDGMYFVMLQRCEFILRPGWFMLCFLTRFPIFLNFYSHLVFDECLLWALTKTHSLTISVCQNRKTMQYASLHLKFGLWPNPPIRRLIYVLRAETGTFVFSNILWPKLLFWPKAMPWRNLRHFPLYVMGGW